MTPISVSAVVARARRSAVVTLVCIAGGCSPGAPAEADGPTVTDSAGVRVVSWAPTYASEAPYTLREVARVDPLDGDPWTLFATVPGGRILDDGSFVVTDRESGEVRRFAPDGALLGAQGRIGEGPGEYDYIRAVGACGAEGFTVFDIDWTMSLYDEGGAFVEERPLRLADGLSPYNLACSRGGRRAVVSWGRLDGPPELGLYTSFTDLRVFDSLGVEIANLGTRIGSERFGRSTGSGPHPVGRATEFDFQGDDLIVADGSFFGYERWSPDGTLREIVRVALPPPSVDSLMAAYLAERLAAAANDDQRRAWRVDIEEMENPAQASYLSDLRATDDAILIREPNPTGEGRWFLFSDDRPVGFLSLPAGAQLLDMRAGRLLLVERDALDVPSIVVYAVEAFGR